jgi:hypothetical protein
MKSKIIAIKDSAGNNYSVCWLGDDKFANDIKDLDLENCEDIDLIVLNSIVQRYFEADELTEENDLIGKSWSTQDDNEEHIIKEVVHSHTIH